MFLSRTSEENQKSRKNLYNDLVIAKDQMKHEIEISNKIKLDKPHAWEVDFSG